MRKAILLFVSVMMALVPIPATAESRIDLSVAVTVSGINVMEKLDDMTCKFTGIEHDKNPRIEISVDGESKVHRRMREGQWKPAGPGEEFPTCSQTFGFSVPGGSVYEIRILPWFVQEYQREELESGRIDVTIHRPTGAEPVYGEEGSASEPTSSDSGTDFTLVAEVPGIRKAEQILYSNLQEETIFTEPLALTFTSYEFATENEAIEGFAVIAAHVETELALLTESDRVYEVSIGRIGDDRVAYIENQQSPTLWTVVRVGSQVLTVLAIGLDGDYPDFVGEFLESYLEDIEGEERSILPELADMPRGWEAPRPIPMDVTDETTPSEDKGKITTSSI